MQAIGARGKHATLRACLVASLPCREPALSRFSRSDAIRRASDQVSPEIGLSWYTGMGRSSRSAQVDCGGIPRDR